MTVKLNLPMCVLLIKSLDLVGYLPLSEWKKLDDVVVAIKSSEKYKAAWDEVYKKAEEIMANLKDKNQPMEEEVTKLQLELQELVAKNARRKDIKTLRQKIWDMANQSQFNIKAAQAELQEFQDKRMDLEAREEYIVEVDEDFYQTLDAKFHIDDKKYVEWEATSGFIKRLDTTNIESDMEIPVDTVVKKKKRSKKEA